MRYRNRKPKRYRSNSPYLSKRRRYTPKTGGGYSGPRPYARSNFRHETLPSSPESYSRRSETEHYTLPSRDYNPEIQQLIFELNQLKNQGAIEQSEKREVSPDGNLLREMLDQSTQQKDFDTVERAENFFKKSSDEEQERIDDFAEWIEDSARQSHPERLFEEEIPEQIQAPKVELEPSSKAELIPSLDAPMADVEILFAELYANPLEAKKEVEPVEQAESNVY